jgi:hypothetical protein
MKSAISDSGEKAQRAGNPSPSTTEVGGSYSITSSARASIEGDRLMPRAFAVLKMTISSNLVACSTGIGAFQSGQLVRHVGNAIKIRRLPVAHKSHLLMDLCHVRLAEARWLAYRERVDIHLSQGLHFHSKPERLFECLGRYD